MASKKDMLGKMYLAYHSQQHKSIAIKMEWDIAKSMEYWLRKYHAKAMAILIGMDV
jgi:hypothetical protein